VGVGRKRPPVQTSRRFCKSLTAEQQVFMSAARDDPEGLHLGRARPRRPFVQAVNLSPNSAWAPECPVALFCEQTAAASVLTVHDQQSADGPMNERKLPLGSRLLLGGLAGFAGTAAMTTAMYRLRAFLPVRERYPLPPREITERLAKQAIDDDASLKDLSLAAHFAFGAGMGALMTATGLDRRAGTGALAGVAVWAGARPGNRRLPGQLAQC